LPKRVSQRDSREVFSSPSKPKLFANEASGAPEAAMSTFGSLNNDSSVAELILPFPSAASIADLRYGSVPIASEFALSGTAPISTNDFSIGFFSASAAKGSIFITVIDFDPYFSTRTL